MKVQIISPWQRSHTIVDETIQLTLNSLQKRDVRRIDCGLNIGLDCKVCRKQKKVNHRFYVYSVTENV